MQALCITKKGIEKVSALEIKEMIGAKSRINETAVLFNAKNAEELCKICYLGRSFTRVIHLIKNFKFDKKKELLKNLDIDLSSFLKKKTFAVRCERTDIKNIHDFTSKDIERDVGWIIFEKTKAKVNLKNPDIVFFVYIYDNDCYFGIDYSGFDLSKRHYKVFAHPFSIKGTISYAMLRFSDWNPKQSLIDPFCGSGTIPIEAALYALNISPHFHRKDLFAFRKFADFNFEVIDKKIKKNKLKIFASDSNSFSIKCSEGNAKAAEIHKNIKFLRMDIEWLDTKFEKESIDRIVTNPPQLKDTEMEKLFGEFFNQANYILNKKGNITMLVKETAIVEKKAKENGFFLSKRIEIALGKEGAFILRFEKQ